MDFSKPVICAVSGWAVAGGLELALMCDMRVVEETAKMGVLCRRFGVPLIDGGTVRLPELIGLSRAMDLILTGRIIEAKEAFDMGLANRLVATGTGKDIYHTKYNISNKKNMNVPIATVLFFSLRNGHEHCPPTCQIPTRVYARRPRLGHLRHICIRQLGEFIAVRE